MFLFSGPMMDIGRTVPGNLRHCRAKAARMLTEWSEITVYEQTAYIMCFSSYVAAEYLSKSARPLHTVDMV